MLQQTRAATVTRYFHDWMKRFPDVMHLAAAAGSDVLAAWEGLGYYSRARNLHAAAKEIMERHGGRFPDSPAELGNLPGVGVYTANAVACFAFGAVVPVVDANVARVLARVENYCDPVDTAAGKSFLWQQAEAFLARRSPIDYNNALMELGAMVCFPGKPACGVCPVRRHCRASGPEDLPVKRSRIPVTRMEEGVEWVEKNGRILLRKSGGPRWKGLWLLPPADHAGEVLATHTYSITRYRVCLRVVRGTDLRIPSDDEKWFQRAKLNDIPMPSPHRAVAGLCLGEHR